MNNKRVEPAVLPTLFVLFGATEQVVAYDLDDTIAVSGVAAGVMQCQALRADAGAQRDCGAALPFQPELSIRPSAADEIVVKLGFGAGNGLNGRSPFILPTWAADLEDDVEDINGTDRSYLLVAGYKHRFAFDADHTLALSAGIIDGTDYLNDNAYADDEYTQFMHPALVNSPNFFVPSYDPGGAIEWDYGRWSTRGVIMQRKESADHDHVAFFGLQVGYRLSTPLGEGHYRVLGYLTTEAFPSAVDDTKQAGEAMLFSADQPISDHIGVFARLGWQSDEPAVEYDSIFSGGIDLGGALWGRPADNVGVGYAFLEGGSTFVRHSHVTEGNRSDPSLKKHRIVRHT